MPKLTLEVPVPLLPDAAGKQAGSTLVEGSDERATFAKISAETPRDEAAEDAFLASKVRLIQSHPQLEPSEKLAAFAELAEHFDRTAEVLKKEFAPTPGGVGYGVFYNSAFKTAFVQGTSFYDRIVCPTTPGGNVNQWLYLTATNRSGKGVEAFVSYYAQQNFHFKVFDWARSDHWQLDCPFEYLGNYLASESTHGQTVQALSVWNSTYQIAAGTWRNEVLLYNHASNRWDLMYRYDYAASASDQTSGWIGSWAPIVEDFQTAYAGTNPMGALSTMLISRDGSGAWGSWQLLQAANAYIRNDGHGFNQVFLDADYAFLVNS